MEDEGGVGGRAVGSVFSNGTMFALNDLVHVFVGTGAYLRGRQTEVIMGRFKGVRVERGEERLMVHPVVGSQRERCPSYPPEACRKLKSFGCEDYGANKPRHFSKLSPRAQERYRILSPHIPAYMTTRHLCSDAHRIMRKANDAMHMQKVKAEKKAKGLRDKLNGQKMKSEEAQARALTKMRVRL